MVINHRVSGRRLIPGHPVADSMRHAAVAVHPGPRARVVQLLWEAVGTTVNLNQG
jgi:hypothetical protein